MVKQTIQIFGRIKPTKAKSGQYEVSEDDNNSPLLTINQPREASDGVVNNKKEHFKFKFQRLFDQKSKQDEIFEFVAQPVIENVLQGYNGTIFAYGQTGSGKTFTITGGAERYIDRGIIPRTLGYIFNYYQENSEYVYTTHVSYLEIYNENGYDLLDPKHEAAKLEDLPKVSLMEDNDQNIHLKNLSTHCANNEEEALNLLFLGDTNRMIAETPMNQASTRSHCIFTIHITCREAGSATIRRAKLHLVDLAGSERVSKTGVNGVLLTEAKYINLSLHYLEQVIVCLGEKTRQHIPYRNSMMTSVLRDSLGGNCMTTMIATMSVEKKNIDESISTARFAQRVALIKNDAILNEELDPRLMIIRLKKEIQQLKEELSMATGEQRTDELTPEELDRCNEAVQQYIKDNDQEAILNVGADMRKIHHCFHLLKNMVREKRVTKSEQTPRPVSRAQEEARPSFENPVYNTPELQKLKGLIIQRDNEINILVSMLKKEKKRAAEAIGQLDKLGQSTPEDSSSHVTPHNSSQLFQTGRNNSRTTSMLSEGSLQNGHVGMSREMSGSSTGSAQPPASKWSSQQRQQAQEREEKTKHQVLGDLSMGRQEAFEIFRRDNDRNQDIDENKRLLKEKYREAKMLGETVNQSRSKINKLKASIEQHRMSRVMQGLVDPNNPEPDEMEQELRDNVEQQKTNYRDAFGRLRSLKTEIEHLQHLLEKHKLQLMKNFEVWWAEEAAAIQQQKNNLQQPLTDQSRTAWRTPPITPIKNTQVLPPAHGELYSADQHRADTSGYESQESSRSQRSRQRHKVRSAGEGVSGSLKGGGGESRGEGGGSRGGIPLTGDAQADADIMAFLKARQNVLKQTHGQGNR